MDATDQEVHARRPSTVAPCPSHFSRPRCAAEPAPVPPGDTVFDVALMRRVSLLLARYCREEQRMESIRADGVLQVRTCVRCKATKEASEFGEAKSCNRCLAARHEYRARPKSMERRREYEKEYRERQKTG